MLALQWLPLLGEYVQMGACFFSLFLLMGEKGKQSCHSQQLITVALLLLTSSAIFCARNRRRPFRPAVCVPFFGIVFLHCVKLQQMHPQIVDSHLQLFMNTSRSVAKMISPSVCVYFAEYGSFQQQVWLFFANDEEDAWVLRGRESGVSIHKSCPSLRVFLLQTLDGAAGGRYKGTALLLFFFFTSMR